MFLSSCLSSSTDEVVGTELGFKQVQDCYMRPRNEEEERTTGTFEGEDAPLSVWRVLTCGTM